MGSLEALQKESRLVGEAGGDGVCVFWHEGRAYALDDRCPHMGFPLHRGSLEQAEHGLGRHQDEPTLATALSAGADAATCRR